MPGCVALVVGAGRGVRFGAEVPKQYLRLAGEPMFRRSMATFLAHAEVDAIRPVIHADDAGLFEDAARGLCVLEPAVGGSTRQESVRLGLESLHQLNPRRVLIHDAARPLVSLGVISRVVAALERHQGAIPALAVRDTLKEGVDGIVAGTVPRRNLWRAQTPQGFRYPEILEAHRRLAGSELTDDAAVAERAGLAVALVEGSEDNVKITGADDIDRARHLLGGDVRTGIGFDVHRFRRGDHLFMCGVRIPFEAGLEGHSDADPGLHAITDALLGAIGAGDIGDHFPPDDPRWQDAASSIFLAHAGDLVAGRGGRITGIDVTIVCEAPRVGPHRARMRETIAGILRLPVDRVSVKATSTERLGFTGRREGVAAQAVASVDLPRVRGS